MKWVSCWGNATSITDRKEAVYAKDITLRYPIFMPFGGEKIRLRFSNLTGTEPITLSNVCVNAGGCFKDLYFNGKESVAIAPGTEIESDETIISISAGCTMEVSIYLGDYTQMNAGTLITGPLSKGRYSYGNFAHEETLPMNLTRNTNWFYFLNTIDIYTEEENHAIICYGDSITAQSWPDYLTLQLWESGHRNLAVVRRAVSGTRILRQYDCITYQAYGLKGATRFPIEMNVSGASDLIIQHGINDIIHPVGKEVNPFRPWSDMPTLDDLINGTEEIYLKHAGNMGVRIWLGTLLPIYGWRTYNEERDILRQKFNDWMKGRQGGIGVIDFDEAVRDKENTKAFAPGFDSGDHLHPSEKAYEAMARCALRNICG